MTLEEVKRGVANPVLWATGLCTGVSTSLGHASPRVPDRPDRFVVKGRGHATAGHGDLLQVEEQARMNYFGLCALGSEHPSLPLSFLEEVRTRGPMNDLPHFPAPFAPAKGQPRVGGLWQYYTAEVSRDL